MLSGQVTAILKDHQGIKETFFTSTITHPFVHLDMEVRDVIFHPYRPLLFSCGDGNLHIRL